MDTNVADKALMDLHNATVRQDYSEATAAAANWLYWRLPIRPVENLPRPSPLTDDYVVKHLTQVSEGLAVQQRPSGACLQLIRLLDSATPGELREAMMELRVLSVDPAIAASKRTMAHKLAQIVRSML